MIYQEMHPVFHYLVGDVQINTLTDAVPFTVAPSFKDKNTLTYTTTGPKEQRAFAVGCWILGPPWFVGGVMLLFANNPNLTAPAWVAYPVLLGGGLLFCINGYRRWGASKRRNQVEINIDTHEIIWAKTRPRNIERVNSAVLMCSPSCDGKIYLVSIIHHDRVLITLGALRTKEAANDLAELIAEETNLQVVENSSRLIVEYSESLTKSDNQALRKPISSKRIKIHMAD